MNKGLRTGLVIGAVVAGIWIVSAIGFTLVRTDCLRPLTARCNGGVIEAFGDIVQLRWVHPYQTLISGMLALLAGTFVYVAARHQSEDLNRREQELQRRTVMGTVATIRTQFVKYRIDVAALRETTMYPGTSYSLEPTREQIGLLGGDNALLADHILAALLHVNEAFKSRTGGLRDYRRRSIERGLAAAIAMVYYLRDPNTLLDDRGVFTKPTFDGDTLRDMLDAAGCTWADLSPGIRGLFTTPEFEDGR